MTSLGSQFHRATFLSAVLLLLLQVKVVKTQKGSASLDDRSQKEKILSAGGQRRELAEEGIVVGEWN